MSLIIYPIIVFFIEGIEGFEAMSLAFVHFCEICWRILLTFVHFCENYLRISHILGCSGPGRRSTGGIVNLDYSTGGIVNFVLVLG